MVKLVHLLVLSVLVVWVAGSGCIGNNSSDAENGGVAQNVAGAGNADDSNMVTPGEIQKLDADMAELQSLLEDASLEEEIDIEIE
jgi:hypothetical protein